MILLLVVAVDDVDGHEIGARQLLTYATCFFANQLTKIVDWTNNEANPKEDLSH